MSKRPKQRQEPAAKPKRKLTAGEKREIRRIMESARGDGKPHTAQDTLSFRQMYPDGLCKLDETTWSRCIEFEDVNYQLAQPDAQTAIFEGLCDLYNSYDSSVDMQISLPCRHMNREDFVKRIEIVAQGDRFDGIRDLYTQMLRRQLERGNNGLVKTKLLILTIKEKDIRTARTRFSRILLDALNHFKVIGTLAKALDGREWLELLHGILPETNTLFFISGHFDEDTLIRMAESVRVKPVRYELGYVPENCVFVTSYEIPGGKSFVYTDEKESLICFTYQVGADGGSFFVDNAKAEKIDVTINGCTGEISLYKDEEETDHIIWTDSTNTVLFYITGHFDQETFIKMAESVIEIE